MPRLHLIRRAGGDRDRRRLDGLIPGLMEDFSRRDPAEVLDCADAVLAYYEERPARRGIYAARPAPHRRMPAGRNLQRTDDMRGRGR